MGHHSLDVDLCLSLQLKVILHEAILKILDMLQSNDDTSIGMHTLKLHLNNKT